MNLGSALAASAWLAICAVAAGCDAGKAQREVEMNSMGNPEHGRQLIGSYGCGACHMIPGIRLAGGRVGPPLDSFARRRTVAGKLANTPDALTHWIQVPQSVVPGNDMPDLGLTRRQARDVAAYLLQRT